MDRFRPPVPKYLLLKDGEGRKYTSQDVMRRTAWMAKALDIRSRDLLPHMKRISFKGVNYISITAEPGMAKKLMEIKLLGPCSVDIYKDPIKNSVQGVVYDADKKFAELSEDSVQKLLSNFGVIFVKRFTKGKDKEPTDSYKLTFDAHVCPYGFPLDGYWYRVKPFVESPLRCYRCQRYEHNANKCRSKQPVCQRCGQSGHQSRELGENQRVSWSCLAPRKCCHCEHEHEAGSKDCPVQKAHWEVNKVMALQQISRYEAKTRVMPQGPRSTDAQVVVGSIQTREREEQSRVDRGSKALEALEKKVDQILEKDAAQRAEPEGISLAEVSNKLDQFLRVCKPGGIPAPVIDEERLTKQVEERISMQFSKRFDELEVQVRKQGEKIDKLKKENDQLKKEKEKLVREKEQEKKEKEELVRQLQALQKELAPKKPIKRHPSQELLNDTPKKVAPSAPSAFVTARSVFDKGDGHRGGGHGGGSSRGARGGAGRGGSAVR